MTLAVSSKVANALAPWESAMSQKRLWKLVRLAVPIGVRGPRRKRGCPW